MLSELWLLNNLEYIKLEELIDNLNTKHPRENFKDHDHPHLLTIPPKIRLIIERDSHLCFVALGDKEQSLSFLDKPLLGWYDVKFTAYKKPRDDFLFYHKHDKLVFVATDGIMYTLPNFRKQGMAKQLYQFTKSILKRVGFGNFECKAENPNVTNLLIGLGYSYSESHRYGKQFNF